MRIAFVVGEFPSLSETFILNQITGLIDMGYEVDIYARKKGDTSKTHPDVIKYNLVSKCTYYNMPKRKITRIVKATGLLFKSVGKDLPKLIKTLNFFKYGKIALSLEPFYQAISFLKNRPYDVVLCHFGVIGNYGAILKDAKIIQGKLITTFHGVDISQYIYLNGNNAYDFLFKVGDLFLPISEYWKNRLIELGCPKDKIIVHRMGIDIEKFKNSDKTRNKIAEGKILIISTARLVEKKGIEYGIKAVIRLLKDYSNIEYLIIGDGPLRKHLENIIKQNNVKDKIKLLGWREQQEVKELLRKADILLAPSVTSSSGDQEGIPVALMEALAMGIPVVSTKHSGIPELIINQETGLLSDERDIEGLYLNLKRVIEDDLLREKMIINGRKKVENEYNINKLNKKLISIFENINIKD